MTVPVRIELMAPTIVEHICQGFLDSEEEYQRVVEYWRALFEVIAADRDQAGDWAPWQPTNFLDGTPTPRDGNPIFEVRSERLGRAVRVIQGPPTTHEPEIAAWTDIFDF